MLVQQKRACSEREAHRELLQKSCAEINTRHDIVVKNIPNNIIVHGGLVSHEQKWEDRKTVRMAKDEITVGTEHWRSDEWKDKGRVAGAKLKPDLVWLRRDSGDIWRKVVVDVKVTSTEKLNEFFNEKDESIECGRPGRPGRKKVAKAVIVPLIISHDMAVHKDTVW